MGLGRLFLRDTQYVATNLDSGFSQTFTIIDNIAPDWSHGEYRGAMSIPGAWRASLLISDLIGSLPWHAYRQVIGGFPQKIEPTPSLLDRPSPPDVRVTTFSSMALDLLWHGNAIAIIAARDRQGWPTAIVPVPAEYVSIRRLGQADNFIGLPVGSVVYALGNEIYSADDVIHIKGPSRPGCLYGMGILENHLGKTLQLAEDQGRQARSLGTSGIPTGLLKSTHPDFDEQAATELKSGWLRSQSDRTVAVLGPDTEFTPLSWSPEETQLLEARKFSLHEIALIFGLDPSWLGVSGASMTYSNVEQEAVNLVKFTLRGHISRFEETLSAHMPRGTWAEANLDGLLRADTMTRYSAYSIAIDKGFLTDDEVRDMERRPPLTASQRATMQPVEPVQADDPATRSVRDLLKYWVRGEGLVKWTASPQPLTALYENLVKYLPPDRAKWTALAWFPLGMGRDPVAADGQLPDVEAEVPA